MEDGAPLFCRWLNTCLLTGRTKLIHCFALLVFMVFAFPIKLFLFQPTGFLAFITPLILSDPTGGGMSEQLDRAWCLTGFKP